MTLSLVTAPSTEPVSLDGAKLHLRVTSEDEDELIRGLIQQARDWVELYTGRALMTQTWDLKLDAFPCEDGPVWLPKPPLVSVTHVKYYDTDGTLQTWATSNYVVDAPAGPHARVGKIDTAYLVDWPTTREMPNAVQVRFVCGYGVAGQVPAGLKGAMNILMGTWFGPGRESVKVGNIVTPVPHTVDALLWPFKVF